mgnify:CR=1 FL=1
MELNMDMTILVVDDESRENEGDIIFPADAATQEKLNLCAANLSFVLISNEVSAVSRTKDANNDVLALSKLHTII